MRAWLHQLISRPSPPPSRYRQLIALLPIPTAEQTESFAEYVVGAHSWYKHLPCDPPGAPFVVFLDPNAGRKLVQTADGGAKYRDCVDERERFHYTWMPTAEYLTKFGHWHYAIDRGTQFVRRLPASDHAQVDPLGFARVTATDGTFPDVAPDSPFCWAIAQMAASGRIAEAPGSDFHPAAPITRAQVMAFMFQPANGEAQDCLAPPFPDVAVNHPSCRSIELAAAAGVASGDLQGNFGPDGQVEREAAAAAIVRFEAP